MPRLHLVVDVINHCEELMQNWPVRSINANNIGNHLCLQRLFSAVKFIAERGLKKKAIPVATGFATVSQIANHCQMPCCIIKFCYS